MHALRHQSFRGPEVCDGIASDEMSEGDFDQQFQQESHKLLCPQRLVGSDVEGLLTKAKVFFAGICGHHREEP